MVSLSSESVQKLALLRFRATGTGVNIVTFFQSYAYDPHDPLEPCRFEALCRLKSIAEFSSAIPEYVPPSPDGKDLAATLELLNDWLLVSSEIIDEIQNVDPQELSPIGARMVDFLSQVMQPHSSIDSLLPSKINKPQPSTAQSQQDKVQTVLDWFEDCDAWILDIKNDLEQSWLREDVLNDIPLPEIYTPLNTFLFAPAVHFIQWLLYYWRRNATTTNALPFEQTAIAPYTPPFLVPFRYYCQNPLLSPSSHTLRFWKASRYPVRGSWGSAEIHDTVCNLLEENIQIANQRIFNHGVMMNAQLSQDHLSSSVSGSSSSSSSSAFSSPEPPTPRPQSRFLHFDMTDSAIRTDGQSSFSLPLSLTSTSSEADTLSYTCTFCTSPSYFTLAKDLKRHVESIHSKSKFYCEVESCSRAKGKGRPFNRVDNLVRHVRSRHGKQVDRYSYKDGRNSSS
ncbi:hypothetical protein ONS95_000402 [Cadophora gregata]|uniref:uncharacterized protein n=1 Tax=Cadophora gregata TaxID=51156 RepID=UPI0026DCCF3C|nr:uncharacterized protein ONS95_000402 [Cadophora gregata]KAK0128429.1 hypothetical protein ONS95_000402 [Cadophora gregata]